MVTRKRKERKGKREKEKDKNVITEGRNKCTWRKEKWKGKRCWISEREERERKGGEGSHKVWSREFHIPLLLTPLTRRKLEGECEDLKLESLPRSSGYPVAIYALARNLQVFKSCLVQERRVVTRCWTLCPYLWVPYLPFSLFFFFAPSLFFNRCGIVKKKPEKKARHLDLLGKIYNNEKTYLKKTISLLIFPISKFS